MECTYRPYITSNGKDYFNFGIFPEKQYAVLRYGDYQIRISAPYDYLDCAYRFNLGEDHYKIISEMEDYFKDNLEDVLGNTSNSIIASYFG